MENTTKFRGPIPGALILTHTHLSVSVAFRAFSSAGASHFGTGFLSHSHFAARIYYQTLAANVTQRYLSVPARIDRTIG